MTSRHRSAGAAPHRWPAVSPAYSIDGNRRVRLHDQDRKPPNWFMTVRVVSFYRNCARCRR